MKTTSKIFLSTLLIAVLLLTSVVSAAAEPAAYMIGDADGDNEVSVLDATIIQRVIASLEVTAYNEAAADADGDGAVNVLDATAIQRHLVDLPTNEKIGKMSDMWLDKEKATKSDYNFEEDLEILEIHEDYFIAEPIAALPYVIRINGSISDHWCVGDHVFVACNNMYYDHDFFPHRYEGDLITIAVSTFVPDPDVAYKPVIYLYPEEETEVDVSLSLNGELLKSEPLYRDGWTVTAKPDGTLTDADGKTYDYLFWEAKLNANYDLSKGFCVKGSDTETFLNDALNKQGLTERETADFIEFWLPIMEKNPYNVISFQTDAYTDAAGLTVSPQPDSVIRVFMTWYAADQAVEIPAQELTAPERQGFTVVEWGGSMVK